MRHIAWRKQSVGGEDSRDHDVEYHGKYVPERSRALSELGGLYQDARGGQSGLPALHQLMGG